MTSDDTALNTLAARAGAALRKRRWRLALAESCTGGWVAKLVTDIPGSSEWFERGYVVYANAAKTELLGVSADTLARHGAVSVEVVRALALGALTRSHAQVALAITGIAGPDGGTPDKPVGTVWFAAASQAEGRVEHRVFEGDRDAVRRQAVAHALRLLIETCAAA